MSEPSRTRPCKSHSRSRQHQTKTMIARCISKRMGKYYAIPLSTLRARHVQSTSSNREHQPSDTARVKRSFTLFEATKRDGVGDARGHFDISSSVLLDAWPEPTEIAYKSATAESPSFWGASHVACSGFLRDSWLNFEQVEISEALGMRSRREMVMGSEAAISKSQVQCERRLMNTDVRARGMAKRVVMGV